MSTEAEFQRQIIKAVRTQLIPRVQQRTARLILGRPPLHVPPEIIVTPENIAPLLKNRIRSSYNELSSWPSMGLHTSRFPLMIYVLEGEADFRVGVTEENTPPKQRPESCGCYVISLPRDTFFLIPPGVPYSDASRPHWERPQLENAHSHLLWFNLLPAGASLHTCSTLGKEHSLSPSLFVGDPDLLQLSDALTDELQSGAPHNHAIATSYLEILLLRIERGFAKRQVLSVVEKTRLFSGQSTSPLTETSTHEVIVHRACQYIEANLNEPLNLKGIAAHVYVSATHLNRLFQSEMKTTVMEFVIARRMQSAKSLLQDTNFPIRHISSYVGYPHVAHFSRLFKQRTGVSPAHFRREHRFKSQ